MNFDRANTRARGLRDESGLDGEPQGKRLPDQPATIFVVDDDPVLRDSIVDLIGSVGLRVETFSSACDLFLRADLTRPGVVLSDVRMPEMSGLDLLHRIKRQFPAIPVILITGHGDTATAVRAFKAGVFDFIEKPFGDEDLLQTVRRAVVRNLIDGREFADRFSFRKRIDSLTPREREVLSHVVTGKLNKVIASELGVSLKTVECHRARVMAKMGVESLAELVRQMVLHPPEEDPDAFAGPGGIPELA